ATETTVLVSTEIEAPTTEGFVVDGPDFSAYMTTVPASWLHQMFKQHGVKLFSANYRNYLGTGTRKSARNINWGIKQTVGEDPGHFWVFNNGITALVHDFTPPADKHAGITRLQG